MNTLAALFLKAPLLLSSAYFSTLCGRSPQPTPKREEESRFAGLEAQGFRAVIRWLPSLLVTPSLWLTFLFETAYIALLYWPPPSGHPSSSLSHLRSALHLDIRLAPLFVTGYVLLTMGTLIRVQCYRHLGRYFTFELALREDHRLITTGPYNLVRHPAYTGSIMALTGIALIELGPGSFWAEALCLWSSLRGVALSLIWLTALSIIPCGIIARTSAEDEVLRREFPEEWNQWAQKTRYKLVPGIF